MQMLEKFSNDTTSTVYIPTFIQQVHIIIHVLCLMNFYIMFTSNLIIKLQMIGYLGGQLWKVMKTPE